MKKLALLKLLLFLSISSFAQDKTKINKADTESYILIVPFEDKMYVSDADIDIDLAVNNNLKPYLICTSVKFHVMKEVASSLRNVSNVMTFEEYETKKANDLNLIYSSIYYEYKLPKKIQKKRNFTTNNVIFKTSKAKKIKQSKLLVKVEDEEVFMAMSEKYNGDLFVFISQVEFKKAQGTTQEAIAKNEYFIQATIHYTLIDNKGKPLKSEVAIAYFPSHVNEIDHISKEFISTATKDIAYNLPLAYFSK